MSNIVSINTPLNVVKPHRQPKVQRHEQLLGPYMPAALSARSVQD